MLTHIFTLDNLPTLALSVIALLAVVAAILRVFSRYREKLDREVLFFLMIAATLVLLRDVKSLAWGDYKLEFQERLANAETTLKDVQKMAVGPGKELVALQHSDVPKPGNVPNDQWKGQFGGKSETGGRKLTATVEQIRKGWYAIDLVVQATDDGKELTGTVQFFLHQTFKNDRPTVTVIDGTASLHIEAYGAFTVGAITDNGAVKLELDLAEDTRFPADFVTH